MLLVQFSNRVPDVVHNGRGLIRLICLLVLLYSTGVMAADSKIYEVNDVPVDATAESAAAARQQALRAGEREAFNRLVRRITLREYHSQLPNPDHGTISTYVRDFAVSDEKTSSVRYLARMHVRFRSNDIRQLLNEFGIPFSETVSKPVLVLPVVERNGVFSLWEETNRWRQAWNTVDNQGRMVPIVRPGGDLTDIATIGTQHTVNGDLIRLKSITTRYDAGSVLVAIAFVDTSAINYKGLEVQLARYGPGFDGAVRTYRFTGPADESLDALMARTVDSVSENLEETWKRSNLMNLDDRGLLPVSVPISSLPDWMNMQQRISRAAVVSKMDVVLLSREEARVNLHFLGTLQQLTIALAQNDLQLTQQEGVWMITDGH